MSKRYIYKKNKLKYYRIWKDIKQSEMAKKIHVSISAYRRYENNQCYVSLNILQEACKIFNISIDQIWIKEEV